MSAPRIKEVEKLAQEVYDSPLMRVSIVAYPAGVRVYNKLNGEDVVFFRTDKAVKQHEGLRALKDFLEAEKRQKGKAA